MSLLKTPISHRRFAEIFFGLKTSRVRERKFENTLRSVKCVKTTIINLLTWETCSIIHVVNIKYSNFVCVKDKTVSLPKSNKSECVHGIWTIVNVQLGNLNHPDFVTFVHLQILKCPLSSPNSPSCSLLYEHHTTSCTDNERCHNL